MISDNHTVKVYTTSRLIKKFQTLKFVYDNYINIVVGPLSKIDSYSRYSEIQIKNKRYIANIYLHNVVSLSVVKTEIPFLIFIYLNCSQFF